MSRYRYWNWGGGFLERKKMRQEAAASEADHGKHLCPVCGKRAINRVFNHHKKVWEFKHSRRPRGGVTQTTYCEFKEVNNGN